jgi:hypothetical protein
MSDWFLSIIIDKFDRAQSSTREISEHWDRVARRLATPPTVGGSVFCSPVSVIEELKAARAELDTAIRKAESVDWPVDDDWATVRVASQLAFRTVASVEQPTESAEAETVH